MKRSLLVALLLVAGCGDTIVNNLPPTAPTTEKAPAVIKTTIEFRVVGNPSSTRVRYSSPVDGLTQVVTSLPYFNSFTTEAASMFLSLEATPVAYPALVTFPFLSIQIVTGGTTFREATSNELVLNTLQVSGDVAAMMADRAAWTKYAGGKLEAPRSKYGAKPMVVDGIRFDSTKEAKRYRDLRLLEKAGVIRDLELQPRFPLEVVELHRPHGRVKNCGYYTADFRYVDTATTAVVVEDVKSGPTKTAAYRLRKRLVEAIHGVKICEV